ncbi:SpoIID/LytB domain-containing protein [Clostridium aceticum]|uniref:SpoIID/LytB domain-containing protein n=1 Tax=Clostridium aceticum TaxID=84022 RepID=A0A0D8ICK8_9CLOT|nr:SpoIID/LytB domain-containing protein [Clostridium aceticum]AKL95172.1 SpoIID/LytB domain-containing protein [Clostridium aceticum]KJF28045.1 hypothetical protein TZ02_05660 [Clostridium aceticum]
MKKTRFKAIVFLILLMIISNVQTVFAFNKAQIPTHIEIGLFFENSAKSTLHLKAVNGFEVGVFQHNNFVRLFDMLDKQEIILRKDTYYMGSGRNYVEYTGSIDSITNTSNLQGPYHVQVADNFSSSIEALSFIQSLNAGGQQPYLVYENGWKVFIGLYLHQEEAQLKAEEISSISGQHARVISPSARRVQVLDLTGTPLFMFDSGENIYFRGFEDKGSTSLVNVEGRNYRGAIGAKRLSASDMSIVNKLLLEEYLYGVVPREMPASWAVEALKAQAVVARGYAVANVGRLTSSGFDLCNTTRSQVYGGYDVEHANSNRAVNETASRVVTYNGSIISAFYHSNSGGHTENSENVWSNPLPYIRGVKDDFSLDAPNSTWKEVFTRSQVRSLLEKNNIFVGDIIDIKATSVSENGRILELTIYGTSRNEVLAKERSRTLFGLKSTWFTVNTIGNTIDNTIDNTPDNVAVNDSVAVRGEARIIDSMQLQNQSILSANGITKITDPANIKIFDGKNYRGIKSSSVSEPSIVKSSIAESFEFVGRGYGHGLGMSQYGAKKMAEEGHNYIQILAHYYTGTKVE